MTIEEVLERNADAVLIKNPDFEDCIIGLSTDGIVIYSLSKMIEWLMLDEQMSYEDSLDYITYNTLSIMNVENHPIILDDL